MEKIRLGQKVRDSVSGFEGIAVSRHTYLNGCDRITVQPSVDKEGKHLDSCSFDEPQLILLDKETGIVEKPEKDTGGPAPYVDSGRGTVER